MTLAKRKELDESVKLVSGVFDHGVSWNRLPDVHFWFQHKHWRLPKIHSAVILTQH